MSQLLNEVMRGDLCAGCGACVAIAPDALDMRLTDDGFLRPLLRASMTQASEALIERVCPGQAQTLPYDSRKRDVMWGPVVTSYKGHAKGPVLRRNSASGGALSAMLVSIIDQEIVDGVVQIRRDQDDPLGNKTSVSRTSEDVLSAVSSRYAPSSPLDILPELLGDGQTYAFVGKPCDIAALSALRQADPSIAAQFPILISFLCAGVPSRHGSAELVKEMGMAETSVRRFDYRGPGWPGQATAQHADGTQATMSYNKSWGDILSKHVQHRCKICADGSGMFADLVFGDVWDADPSGFPNFEERPGESLILARTELGQKLLADADKWLATEPYDLDQLSAIQPGQTRRRKALLARLAGLWVMGRPVPRYRGFGLLRLSYSNALWVNIRNFLGTMRRAWRGRRSGAC